MWRGAKAYGCRHGRKSLTAGAVETLLEQKATLVPAASVTDGMGGLVRLKGLTVDVTARKRAEDHQSLLIAALDHHVKTLLAEHQLKVDVSERCLEMLLNWRSCKVALFVTILRRLDPSKNG